MGRLDSVCLAEAEKQFGHFCKKDHFSRFLHFWRFFPEKAKLSAWSGSTMVPSFSQILRAVARQVISIKRNFAVFLAVFSLYLTNEASARKTFFSKVDPLFICYPHAKYERNRNLFWPAPLREQVKILISSKLGIRIGDEWKVNFAEDQSFCWMLVSEIWTTRFMAKVHYRVFVFKRPFSGFCWNFTSLQN